MNPFHLIFFNLCLLLAACVWDRTNESLDSLPLDDSEYPYAGLPRLVIETENFTQVRDKETKIPAQMQIWGEKEPESEVIELTVKGRGNSSFEMSKYSIKLELTNKREMLGMPADKDWALISNHADKTLMRNYIAFKLSAKIGSYYAPRCEFVELYLNRKYQGVYLLTETIKIGDNRINIPKNRDSYLVEFDARSKKNDQTIYSDVFSAKGSKKIFTIHEPKNALPEELNIIQNHICEFEEFLKSVDANKDNKLEKWIDLEESIKHYWIQEFARNPDSKFFSSVYFTWTSAGKIRMGPVWDFDLAFGNHYYEGYNSSVGWEIRNYWNTFLFKDSLYRTETESLWVSYRKFFESSIFCIDTLYYKLKKAADNNFKRWPILPENSGYWLHSSYSSYEQPVDDLKVWIRKRFNWIDAQILIPSPTQPAS